MLKGKTAHEEIR